MPYKAVGQVKNATINAAVNMTAEDGKVKVIVYATGQHKAKVNVTYGGNILLKEEALISPTDIFEKEIIYAVEDETKLTVCVTEGDRVLVAYTPEKQEIEKLPDPAEAVAEPEKIATVEELYLAGLHIEQYRHATYLPDPYYLEALKRDPGDIRVNNAYGALLMRRCNFAEAKKYLEKALERMTKRNPNPYSSEAYYNLGLVKLFLGDQDGAYDDFFKATWSNEQQEMSFYYLAAIDACKGAFAHGLEMVDKGLVKNAHNIKARGLKVYLLRKLGRIEEAKALAAENLALDPFDFMTGNEMAIMEDSAEQRKELNVLMRDFAQNYLMTARDYAEAGAYAEAVELLDDCKSANPLVRYYQGYYLEKMGKTKEAEAKVAQAEKMSPDYCFPNKMEDVPVLRYAARRYDAGMAAYYLGNLFFDKLQWQEAVGLWEKAAAQYPDFPTVHRNLSLAYFNKIGDREAAKREMEKAFALDTTDVRVFLEMDQLYKKLDYSFADRLAKYEEHREMIAGRDDLFIEYITLQNMVGDHKKAYDLAMGHRFHTWEGGEGKITTQYTMALVELAKKALKEGNTAESERLLRESLSYPENLGEGKLEGTKDNHVYYNLGLALEAQGRTEEAGKCYETATVGTDEPAGMMYYNDQPADMIMYQGLAKLKLGRAAEAKSRFYRLIDYGEQHLWDEVKIGYFAVSLPEFQIFNEDYTARNKAHCYYLMGLGNWGLGNEEKAKEFFHKALDIEPSHMQCTLYLSNLES